MSPLQMVGTRPLTPLPPQPLPGPSSPRGDLSPPPPDLGNPGSTGNPGATGNPGNTGDTPGRNRRLGLQFGKVKKKLQERWVVRKHLAPSPSSTSPALPLPQPMGSLRNPTPSVPARLEESGQAHSLGSVPLGDGPLLLRSPGEPAAPQTPPAQGRRSRQPPNRYQAGVPTPAHRTRKEAKGNKEKKL